MSGPKTGEKNTPNNASDQGGFIKSWLGRHWRGDAGLVELAVINLFGVSASAAAILHWLPKVAAVPAAIVAAVLVCWQGVGTIRSLDRFLASSTGLLSAIGLCALLLVGAVVTADRAITGVSRLFLDPTLGEFVPPPAQAALSHDGQTLHLTGEISYEMLAQFDAVVTDSVVRVVLTSDGGNIPAARVLVARILSAGLDTEARSACLSACTLVFAAGDARSLADGARLGFHGYAIFGEMRSGLADIPAEEERDKSYLAERGIAGDFINRAYATSNEEIWIPTHTELVSAGVLTN